MRVKKLSANRRPKAGDDDDSTASLSPSAHAPQQQPQPHHKWVSPSKPSARGLAFSSSQSGEIGSSSPTDPSGVHPIELADAVPAHLFAPATTAPPGSTSPSSHHHALAFRDAVSTTDQHTMPSATATASSSRDVPMRKPTASPTATKANGSGSTWRAHVADSVRDSIHAKIVDYLRALKPHAPEKVLARLPGLATRMEESLLRLASSLDEYTDLKTLASRLSAIQQSRVKTLLQQQTAASPPARASATTPATSSRAPLSEDQARFVFQCLQSWRQKLVNMYGVDPWEILPNAILAKVAVYAPATEQELAVCGVQDEPLARFGSSLLQELERICGTTVRTASPAASIAKARASASAKASRKAETSKRAQDPKRRKTSALAPAIDAPSSARLGAPSSFLMPAASASTGAASAPSSMMSPSQLLFRPNGLESLPTLLPSTAGSAAGASASSYNPMPARLSPSPPAQPPPPFFSTRLPSPHGPQQTPSSSVASDENHHMHLLAQGAGHVSKQQQQTAKTIEAYEKELQALRWLLQQSQHDKAQLEDEVQRLRRQLSAQDPTAQS